jgi:hypothetical protein
MSTSTTQAIAADSWFARAWAVTSDLFLATALIWALPLLLAALTALGRLFS